MISGRVQSRAALRLVSDSDCTGDDGEQLDSSTPARVIRMSTLTGADAVMAENSFLILSFEGTMESPCCRPLDSPERQA